MILCSDDCTLNAFPDFLENSTLSLSYTFRRQLIHFYFSLYKHTERVRGYFTVNALHKLLAYFNLLTVYTYTVCRRSPQKTSSKRRTDGIRDKRLCRCCSPTFLQTQQVVYHHNQHHGVERIQGKEATLSVHRRTYSTFTPWTVVVML